MFCTKCGSNVPDGNRFCPNCGSSVGSTQVSDPGNTRSGYQNNQPSVYGGGNQPYNQNPYSQQQYRDPFQQDYKQPVYGNTSSQYVINNNMNQPAPAPVRQSNGPAIAGLVFGILTLILLVVAALLFSSMFSSMYGSYRSYNSSAIAGGAIGAGVCFGFACILIIFNFIFSLIGFIRGLKTKVKMVVGIIGFVLMLLNIGLMIWEIIAYMTLFISLVS